MEIGNVIFSQLKNTLRIYRQKLKKYKFAVFLHCIAIKNNLIICVKTQMLAQITKLRWTPVLYFTKENLLSITYQNKFIFKNCMLRIILLNSSITNNDSLQFIKQCVFCVLLRPNTKKNCGNKKKSSHDENFT